MKKFFATGTLIVISAAVAFGQGTQAANEALWQAARDGDTAAITAALAKGADVDAKSRYDVTALIFAAGSGRLEAAKLLIARGANVNAQDTFYRARAAEMAITNGHVDVTLYLLQNGAEADGLLAMGVQQNQEAIVKAAVAGKVSRQALQSALAHGGTHEARGARASHQGRARQAAAGTSADLCRQSSGAAQVRGQLSRRRQRRCRHRQRAERRTDAADAGRPAGPSGAHRGERLPRRRSERHADVQRARRPGRIDRSGAGSGQPARWRAWRRTPPAAPPAAAAAAPATTCCRRRRSPEPPVRATGPRSVATAAPATAMVSAPSPNGTPRPARTSNGRRRFPASPPRARSCGATASSPRPRSAAPATTASRPDSTAT